MTEFIICLVNGGETHYERVDATNARVDSNDNIVLRDDGEIVALFTLWAWYAKADALNEEGDL